MFLDNKYTSTYHKIINHFKTQNHLNVYTETHHIIPRSLGGTDDSDNLVNLTAKAHFIVHHLLTKMTEGEDKIKMLHAFWRMIHAPQHSQKITAKTFESIKIERSSILSEQMTGCGNHFYGKTHSTETKEKMRQKALGRNPHDYYDINYPAWNKGLTKESSEAVRKMAMGKLGQNNPMFGKCGHLHPNSVKLKLFNNQNILVSIFGSKRELQQYCRDNNIPFKGIYDSIISKQPFIDGSKNGRYTDFNGWYCEQL